MQSVCVHACVCVCVVYSSTIMHATTEEHSGLSDPRDYI